MTLLSGQVPVNTESSGKKSFTMWQFFDKPELISGIETGKQNINVLSWLAHLFVSDDLGVIIASWLVQIVGRSFDCPFPSLLVMKDWSVLLGSEKLYPLLTFGAHDSSFLLKAKDAGCDIRLVGIIV